MRKITLVMLLALVAVTGCVVVPVGPRVYGRPGVAVVAPVPAVVVPAYRVYP